MDSGECGAERAAKCLLDAGVTVRGEDLHKIESVAYDLGWKEYRRNQGQFRMRSRILIFPPVANRGKNGRPLS
jgi:hypothetical protein